MASILLIEDGPGVGRELTNLLTAAGHRVLRCGGGPTPAGRLPAAAAQELPATRCRRPAGVRLPADPAAARPHLPGQPPAARLPCPSPTRTAPLVLVTAGPAPEDLEGSGPTELVGTFADPGAVMAAMHRLLHRPEPMPTLSAPPAVPA